MSHSIRITRRQVRGLLREEIRRRGRGTPEHTLVLRTGAENPYDEGGGVVVRTDEGLSWWFWEGFDVADGVEDRLSIVASLFENADEAERTMLVELSDADIEVRCVPVPDDVLAEHAWVDVDQVAEAVSVPADRIREMSSSDEVAERVAVLEAIVHVYGTENIGPETDVRHMRWPEINRLTGLDVEPTIGETI